MRQASDEGVEFLSQWEGTRLKAYPDVRGLLTIGTGHLLTRDELTSGKLLIDGGPVRWRKGLSKSQALLLLDQDLDEVEKVLSLDRICLRLAQTAYDALCSFVFNVGTGAWRGSTFRRLLLAGKLTEAKDQFSRWVYAGGKIPPGLPPRREAERVLFWEGTYLAP